MVYERILISEMEICKITDKNKAWWYCWSSFPATTLVGEWGVYEWHLEEH